MAASPPYAPSAGGANHFHFQYKCRPERHQAVGRIFPEVPLKQPRLRVD